MLIVWNGMDLIILAVGAVGLLLLLIAMVMK